MNEYGAAVHLTFGRQVFAAVLELDEFLKEEEEERRQKEKKVSRTLCKTYMVHIVQMRNARIDQP